MNWYVKWECSEEISGPMTKDQALDLSDEGDGMVFNESIFFPKFVISEEVEQLLSNLRGLKDGKTDDMGDLCQEAIDTIILLSREKPDPTSGEMTALITGLEAIESVGSDMTDGGSGPSREADVARRAIDTITLLSREKVVRGDIEGGVLNLTEVSEGILVDIRDRDCEGTDEDDLEEDEDGSYFQAGQ